MLFLKGSTFFLWCSDKSNDNNISSLLSCLVCYMTTDLKLIFKTHNLLVPGTKSNDL